MTPLSLEQVEYSAHRVAKELMNFDEPLPAFESRYPGVLESCLAQPFVSFAGMDPYPALVDKAAILFYLMIKNHPFENGNKRLAVTTTLLFLYINDHWLRTDPQNMYEIAIRVAKSKSSDKQKVVGILTDTFQEFLIET